VCSGHAGEPGLAALANSYLKRTAIEIDFGLKRLAFHPFDGRGAPDAEERRSYMALLLYGS
jgi:hypothetical protein